MHGALQTWSLAIPLTLFLMTLEISQPKCMPAPPHRLLVVPSLFLAHIHTVVDIHTGSWPNTGRGSSLPHPGLVLRTSVCVCKGCVTAWVGGGPQHRSGPSLR